MVEGFRLSPQQRRLWIQEQEGSAGAAHCTIAIAGEVDSRRLAAAVGGLATRHEILRTHFKRSPGIRVPIQVVAGLGETAWREIELAPGDAARREPADLLAAESSLPFDLEGGPLLRALLVRLPGGGAVLHLSAPAVAVDGPSLCNLFADLVRSYQGEEEGEEPVQYLQYSEWHHEHLESAQGEEGRSFWRRRPPQSGDGPLLPLESAATGGRAPARRLFSLDAGERLAGLLATHGATAPGLLLTCWNVLLARLVGYGERETGFVGHERKYRELDEVVGPLAAAVPIVTPLQGDQQFLRAWKRTDQAIAAAREWQECYPPDGEVAGPAIGFEVTAIPAPQRAGGALFTLQDLDCPGEPFRLKLSCLWRGDRLAAAISYAPERFAPELIDLLAERFRTLVESALAAPEASLDALELLGAGERRRILESFNATRVDFPPVTIDRLLVAGLSLRPEADAVVAAEARLTHGELLARVHRLAHHLRGLGVGPDVPVAVFLPRSAGLVVAILAILEAGGAFLPLDPGYPRQRLDFMLADSGARLLVTMESFLALLPGAGLPALCLDRDAPAIARQPEADPGGVATPDNLAYVIYTSGSTGRPKGTMIPHRGLVNYLRWCTGFYGAGESAGAPLHSPVGFDLTITSLFAPLLAGGAVHLVPEEAGVEGLAADLLQAPAGYSFVKLTPAHLEILGELVPAAAAAGRTGALVVGGEALRYASLAFWRANAPATRLINEYGPTETVVGCSIHEVAPMDPAAGVVPIGRPIANTGLYLLDAGLRPVPLGSAGEIFIGGAGLARGYLGRPDLTAERFVPSPWSGPGGERLYRTGDLARFLLTDRLEFLGRADGQVKIRGFRVELGEIEQVLGDHPAVREAAVMVRDEAAGPRLVAFVVADAERRPGEEELRQFLQASLPEHMVPSVFIPIPALPLTANGKVDRAALLRVEEPSPATSFAAPRTQVESLLADLWAQLLRRDKVGLRDNFFDLGGHSLFAMQLVARLRNVFGVELSINDFLEEPTLAGLAGTVERALQGGETAPLPVLRPAGRSRPLPLSFAQERVWLLEQMQPGTAVFNVPADFSFTGELDVPALAAALDEIIRRHEVLRTSFQSGEEGPVQVIAPFAPRRLPVVDLGGLPATSRSDEAARLSTAWARAPFDLGRGPLLRAALLSLAAGEHRLLLTLHHIACDAWSMEILIGEWTALYSAFAQGAGSPLPDLPVQYADFASWQRLWLRGDVLARQLAFWRDRLENAPPALDLPTSRPRPAVQTFRGAKSSRPLAPALVQRLESFSRAERVTLFMALLTGFESLLYRYTGQETFLVGTPIAGRGLLALEGLIGFFINTLVLRAGLAGGPDFRQLLNRVRGDTLSAFVHPDFPLEKLLEELPQERDRSRPPLFQVVFSMQSAPALPAFSDAGLIAGSGLAVTALASGTGTSKVDLNLEMSRGEHGLSATLEYNTDLFDPAFADALLGHFETLLEGAVARPDLPISDLVLLSDSERRQLLAGWSAGPVSTLPEPFLHRLFERQAERDPTRIAAVCGGSSLTYGDLDRRANRLARHLGTLGVGPEQLVGVCLERSLDMVVALLAVLKAGAAYVPLDPAYPMERLAFVLDDAQIAVLITQEAANGNLPAHWAFVIDMDTLDETIAGLDDGNPQVPVAPENLAYAIYTSGSTGRPKGVLVPHAGLANLGLAQAAAFGIDADSRVLQFASLSFDASVSEVAMAFAAGATLVLADRESLMPGPDLLQLFGREAITHVTLPPSSLAVLPPSGAVPATLVIAGEACPPELVARWAPERRFFNAYGPTECTVCATLTEVAADGGRPPIGRPLANTRIYLFDPRLAAVPAGVPGELYVGGIGVARGYLHRPEATAESFVPDPYSAVPGERLYRTGDLGRFRADGRVEFLGRRDDQVKIRGFRVEPGEIEAVLSRHPAVEQCAVIAREDGTGGPRLVAYFVPRAASTPNPAALRGFLQDQLPAHLVPAAFIPLPTLPLLPNGKVDRRHLPDPDRMGSQLKEAVAPRDHVEELLAGIWREVLGIERCGVEESFFDLGGYSLAGTQVLSRVREVFGVEVPLGRLFAQPTLAGLAGEVAEALRGGVPTAPPLLPAPEDGDAPLSFSQELMWRGEQAPGGGRFNVVPTAIRLTGDLDVAALEGSLREIVRRHAALRTSFPLVDGRPVQRVGPVPAAALPFLDLAPLAAEEWEPALERLARAEAERPFELASGPVLRPLLVRLGEEEHALLLTAHHIAVDAWSAGVFARELAVLYEALQAGVPSPLPELTVQYADFARWQRDWLRGTVLEGELAWWRGRLAGAVPVELFAAAARRARGSASDMETVLLPAPLASGLEALGRRHGATLSMVLLAAFDILLSELTGQLDLLVATPVANRNRLEIEPLIGFFANTLVLRADLAGDPTFAGLLAAVREAAVGAFMHQDLPFDVLVEALGKESGMTREDFFRVGFNMQNTPAAPLDLRGVRIEPFAVEDPEARSDLLLGVSQGAGGILCRFQYRQGLFDRPGARDFAGQFLGLLEEVAGNPDRRLSELARDALKERS